MRGRRSVARRVASSLACAVLGATLGCTARPPAPSVAAGTLSCPYGMEGREGRCWTLPGKLTALPPPAYDPYGEIATPASVPPASATGWATLMVAFHRRVHGRFSDDYLGSLEGLPLEHAVNQGVRIALVDVAIGADGALRGLTLVRGSGVASFDRAALDAVAAGAPYEPPPAPLVRDGQVAMRWLFARPPALGCSPAHGRPLPR